MNMQHEAKSKNGLSAISLVLSSMMLLSTAASIVLLFLYGGRIPYDANFIPILFLIQIGICLLTAAVAFGVTIARTNWCSLVSLLIAVVATVVSGLAFVLLCAIALANHPI